jgi:predicted nucleic acid-binding protein
MRAVFVDTSFWVALVSERENRHAEAVALSRDTTVSRQLVTTNHVRGETWTFLRSRHGHRVATTFLDRVDRTRRLRVAFISEQLERDAIGWLRRHDEREYSFVDATSFALMRSLKIREAFAFDGDFSAAGFVELRSEPG